MFDKMNRFRGAIASLTIISLLSVLAFAGGGQAPTGTYTASIGNSAGTVSGGAAGRGGFRGRGQGNGAASGKSVTMNVAGYSTQEEMQKLRDTQGDPNAFFTTLNSYNHGTVAFEGQTFTVNAAYSVQTGSKYFLYLLTAGPLKTSQQGPRGRVATGAGGGYIRLTVDANGVGEGVLYTSTQVVVKNNGEIEARAGASTATQLTGVARQ